MADGAPLSYSSQAYKASDVVLASPATVQLVTGFNPQAVDLYLLFFNLIAVPAANTVPAYPVRVPAGGSFSWGPFALVEAAQEGADFFTGCCYAVSTTGNLYTVSALGFWVDVRGRRRS